MIFKPKNRSHFILYKKIIFVTITILLFYILYILGNFIFFKKINNTKYENNDLNNIFKTQYKTIFNIKELNLTELKNRIIVLNVYNISDFSYIFSIELANNLEKLYKDKITIIDVVTNTFEINKNTIINYIIKNNIERPVINIPNLNLNTANGYFMAIDGNGLIRNTFLTKKSLQNEITTFLDTLLLENKKNNSEKLTNIILEKNKNPEHFIRSLNRIKYLDNIEGTMNGPYFVITDAHSRKIYFLTINGKIVNQIGSGKKGNENGQGINASFCYPFGIEIQDNKIMYITDICNNSIREINLKNFNVTNTIKDEKIFNNPLDIEIFNGNLIISSATDNNKLIKYNLKNKTFATIPCEDCGNYILKLQKYDNKLYFINDNKDKNKYGLYSLNKENKIKEEIDFNRLNSLPSNLTKITGNNNFYLDETGLYIIDKFNNRILKIKNDDISEYSSNKKSNTYNLPTDILNLKDKLYITNENDKKLITIDKNTKNTDIINISFGYEYNKIKAIQDDFLNVNNMQEIKLNFNQNLKIIFNLKDSYSFEKMAPQYLALFQDDKKNGNAILIKNYNKNEIIGNKFLLIPNLELNQEYYLKGNFYYCNYKEKTPCLIKKYNKKIIFDEQNGLDEIAINFLY